MFSQDVPTEQAMIDMAWSTYSTGGGGQADFAFVIKYKIKIRAEHNFHLISLTKKIMIICWQNNNLLAFLIEFCNLIILIQFEVKSDTQNMY